MFLLHAFVLLLLKRHLNACGGGSGCCTQRPPPPVVSCGSGCQQGYQCGAYGCTRRKALSALTSRIDGVIVGDDGEEEAHTAPLDPKATILATNFTHDKLTRRKTLKRVYGSDSRQPIRRYFQRALKNLLDLKIKNPNFIFHTCCEARGLPESCLRYCHFNTYTAHSLEQMFYRNDKCPIEAAHEIHYCAAQGMDHTECCTRNGVGDTAAGDKCLAFCDQRPNRFTPIDVSYIPCYDIFESMKRCFFTGIRQKAEEKFGQTTSLLENSFNEEKLKYSHYR